MILLSFYAFFATLFFSIIFNVPKKELILCGISGSIAWFIYLYIFKLSNSVVLSSFISALYVSSISIVLAKIRKVPVTIYFISGIITLVPGSYIYKTMYSLISSNTITASQYGSTTLQVGGVIAFSMLLTSSINKLLKK